MPDLDQIHQELILLLSEYHPPLEKRGDREDQFNLYGTKTVQFGKSPYEGMYFASSHIRKGYVGFYFFPIYTDPDQFDQMPEKLRKCLKGKSCFHIKQLDDEQKGNISKLLKQGYELYNSKDWF